LRLDDAAGEAEVIPCAALVARRAQQIRGMKRHDEWRTAIREPLRPQPRQRRFGLEQAMRGMTAERDGEPRIDELYLSHQIRLATFDFVRLRIAVPGGPALQNIGDVDVFALQSDRFDHRVQQLTGAAHERLTEAVFIGAWRFTDEHPLR